MLFKPYSRCVCRSRLVTFIGGVSLAARLLAQNPEPYSVRFCTTSGTNSTSSSTTCESGARSFNAMLVPGTIDETSYIEETTSESRARSSLQMIAPQAQAHITYALNLAERGAVQSAQAEFIMALDLVADALDADTHSATREHARAVKAGLTAIEETKDFVPADMPHDVEINLAQLASTHQTLLLKNVDTSRMTRAEALQHYHTYATQQLAFAGANSAIASAALYGLGRAETITKAGTGAHNPLGGPNAMALYQAALLVDSKNYMAANELGVLMARYGDLDAAEVQLRHSLAIKPQVETWHNLAAVYRSKSDADKAQHAEQEREQLIAAARSSGAAAENPGDIGSRPIIRWVAVDAFASSGTPYGLDGPPINGSSAKAAPASQQEWFGRRMMAKLNPWSKPTKPEQREVATQVSQRPDSP